MRLKRYLLSAVSASLCILGLSVLNANAETSAFCTPITQSQIPYTITTGGVYCLASDLVSTATSGNVITVNVGNVVIDLNDHRIGGGLAGLATQAIGIYSNSHSEIVIKNGLIRGFYYGIKLEDTTGNTSRCNVVENIRAESNTQYGIYIAGLGSRVHYVRASDTGGSTVPGSLNAIGIYVDGASSRVRDNAVYRTTEQSGGSSYAIYLGSASSDSMVDDNQISNPVLGSGTSTGIYVDASNVIALNNKISNMTNGLSFIDGTGIYKNNFAIQVNNPFSGGMAADASVTNYHNP